MPPIVIGLGLASNAVSNVGFTDRGTMPMMIVAIITVLLIIFILNYRKGISFFDCK